MKPSDVIKDFKALVDETIARSSQYKLAGGTGHDKATIRRWRNGQEPRNGRDVANVIRTALAYGVDVGRYQAWRPLYRFSSELSYEQTIQEGTPDLAWLTQVQSPPPVPRQVCGITVDCPLGIASGPLVADEGWARLMLDLGYGLSTLKTRRSGHKASFRPPQVGFVSDSPDLSGYDPSNPPEVVVSFDRRVNREGIPNLVNSIGVPSESLQQWQETYRRIRQHPRGKLVGLSVMGDAQSGPGLAEDFDVVVHKALELGPPFVELNLSCPNLGRPGLICDDRDTALGIVTAARNTLRGRETRLFVKLPFLPTPRFQELLQAIGPLVDAVVIHNTVRVRPVVVERDGQKVPAFSQGREVAGLSGPCTFTLGRQALAEVVTLKKQLGLGFAVVGVGGVATEHQVIELLEAGVDAVQTCTAAIFDPLLPWKVRFRMAAQSPQVKAIRRLEAGGFDDQIALPNDAVEQRSFRNAETAVKELFNRKGVRVPHDSFVRAWNEWMWIRADSGVGMARRSSAARTTAEWIQVFERLK